LLAGLSYSLWFQALTAEAYALNSFFAALVLFLFLRLGEEGPLGPLVSRRQKALLLLLLAVHGLSMGNHPVTIVFLPALAWLAWTGRAALRNRGLATLAVTAWAGGAFLPYLSLPWAARAHPTNPFGDVTSVSGLLRHMLGAQWTGEARSYGFDADRFAAFPAQLWHELFAVGLVGLALGLAWLWKKQRVLLAFVVVVALPAALLPLAYLRGGEYDFWLLPLYLLCFAVAGLGLGWLFGGIARARIPLPLRIALVTLMAAGALAGPLAVNPELVSRRGDSVPEDFGRNLYRPLKPEAVLVVTSDQENALTYYLEVVEQLRPDVARVDAGSVATPWYAGYLRARYPGLEVPESFSEPGLAAPQRIEALALANFRRRPFYVTGLPTFEPPAGAEWVPAGGLFRLSPTPGEPVRRADWDDVYRNPVPFDRKARDHAPRREPDGAEVREAYTAQIRRFHVQAWKNLGDWSLDRGGFAEAADAYRHALETDPSLDHAGILFGLGKALFLQDRNAEALPYLERASGRLDPGRLAEASLYIGQILAERGERAAALDRFAAVRALVPAMWPQIEASLRQKGLLP
jgi:tetratricopeptide (TPR) repeat protein